MSTSGAVKVSIDVQVGGAPRASFGIPVVIGYHTEWPERIRYFTDANDLLPPTGTFTSDHPIYKAVAALLAQGPSRVSRVGVGRLESAVSLDYLVELLPGTLPAATLTTDAVYSVSINDSLVSYAVGATEVIANGVSVVVPAATTKAAVVNNLVAGLNDGTAFPSSNWTATDNTDGTFDVVGNALGDYYCLAALLPNFSMKNNTLDGATSLVDELAAIQAENDEWYTIIPTVASTPRVLAIASFAQTACKAQIASSSDTDILDAVDTDTGSQLLALSRERTMFAHHDNDCQYLSAAIAGRGLPQDVGAINWAWQGALSGVVAPKYNATQVANAEGKRTNLYREDCGGAAFFFGFTSSNNWFFDLARSRDWLIENIKKDLCDLLVRLQKVSFDDPGISLVKGTILGRLTDAVNRGILAADPAPVVTVPLAANVPDNDKANRCLNDVTFVATLAGAINKICVEGDLVL